jgi:hypothetical protein
MVAKIVYRCFLVNGADQTCKKSGFISIIVGTFRVVHGNVIQFLRDSEPPRQLKYALCLVVDHRDELGGEEVEVLQRGSMVERTLDHLLVLRAGESLSSIRQGISRCARINDGATHRTNLLVRRPLNEDHHREVRLLQPEVASKRFVEALGLEGLCSDLIQ